MWALLCAGFWLGSAVPALAHAPGDHPKDPPIRPLAVATLGAALQDAQQKAFFTPFTAQTHIGIHAGSWDGTLAALQNRARAGGASPDRDLVLMDNSSVLIACRQGLLLPLDLADMQAPAPMSHSMLDPDAVSRCGLGALRINLVLAWDKSRIDAVPGWADFWDVARRPGKRGLGRDPRGTLEIALLADGIAPDSIYRTLATSEGLDRAFRKLDQLKPYIVWWDTPAQAAHAIESGAVLMTSAPNGEVAAADLIGHRDFGIQWQQSISTMLSWAVPGRPHPVGAAPGPDGAAGADAAGRMAHIRQLLDLTYEPDRQAAFVSLYPAISLVADVLSPDEALPEDSPSTLQHLHDAMRQDDTFWATHLGPIRARFDAWIGN